MRNAAAALALISGSAFGGDIVLLLGDPRPADPGINADVLRLSAIDDHGIVHGDYRFPDAHNRLVRATPDGIDFIGGTTDERFYTTNDLSRDGSYILAATTSNLPAGSQCEFSGTRFLRIHTETGVDEYLPHDCPDFIASAMSADGSTVAGFEIEFFPLGDDAFEQRRYAAVWQDGATHRLPIPASPIPGFDVLSSSMTGVAADNSTLVGSVQWEVPVGDVPTRRAVRWAGGEPDVLPHAPIDTDAPLSSGAIRLSADGSTILGGTSTLAEHPGCPGIMDPRWNIEESFLWIWQSGEYTEIFTPDAAVPTDGLTADGSLLFGSSTPGDGTPHGLVWTEPRGLERAEPYLASRGIDLGGREIRSINDISDNGHWMLVVFDAGDDLIQHARIAIPCSPADLTADRTIAPDDLAVFIERFQTGHPLADLSGDGLLGLGDIVAYIGHYLDGCEG